MQVYADIRDVDELMYTYQIVDAPSGEGYSIWVSTGALSGHYIGGEFDTFAKALTQLAVIINDESWT